MFLVHGAPNARDSTPQYTALASWGRGLEGIWGGWLFFFFFFFSFFFFFFAEIKV